MKELKLGVTFCILSLISVTGFAEQIRANVAEAILTPPLEIGYTITLKPKH